jgi:signal peptidase II
MSRNIVIAACVALLSVVIDRITKAIVMEHMMPGQSIPADHPFISLYYTRNTGIAFSLFDGIGGSRWVLVGVQAALAACIIVIMAVAFRRSVCVLASVALALMFGGGVGNLIDRIAYGSVTDIVSDGGFPVFNFAYTCLTVGCAILIVYLLFFHKPDESEKPDNPDGGNSA